MGSVGNADGSGATSAVPLPAAADLSLPRASRPERRAARGPSTGSGAPALHVQHEEIVTESNEPWSETALASSGKPLSVHVGIPCMRCLRRRHVFAAEVLTYQARLTSRFR